MLNRIPIVLARINEDISIGQYEERIRNLVRDVEFAYWDLSAAYFNVETARAAVDSTAIARKIANAKRSTSLVELHAIKGTLLEYNNIQLEPSPSSSRP